MRSHAARVRAALAAAAFAALSPVGAADPVEVDPDVAKRDADYASGKKAVDEKNWAEAVRFFELSEKRHPESADLQNLLGFSYRNLDRFDLAFKHYERAIAIDPRHHDAHGSISEAYLLTGNLAGAEKHLAAVKENSLLPSEELKGLETAIAAYRAKTG